ncbi:PREDICTED: LOW QUALITY PROTEIN: otopetrin-1 [Miniopterus natalensis]|uniref:LOW QUALITY PROTEIN: otopetrin-1 n=1 Tax=Miniopterus natalensis TaxID=291302 RepID=UPI0007A6F4E2|nr:PREDICTED: LOW QUALITY PROTEIN: otopetrin-1 [Miniopterus natalensis]
MADRSITLFAVITIILGCLKVGYFIGFSECLSATEGVFPVTHAVHTLVQVYFLWGHAKDIIQSFKTLERFGVIHSVFTNLLLWANSVLNESKHQLNEHKERLLTLGFGNITIELDDHTPPCNCSPPALCSAISQGIYYLYPFNIEYQILASTMLYVLWKNIGRKVDGPQRPRMRLRFQGVAAGSALGLGALAATIGVVPIGVVGVYLVQIGRSRTRSESALTMFYLYATALLALMGAAGLAGTRIYRLDHEQPLDESKNPARKLDVDLLVGTASGSWLLSWGSILAILCAQARPPYTWYNLPYSVLVIAEKYIQNLFIIESAHREPGALAEDIRTLRVVSVCNGAGPSPAPPCLKSGAEAGDTAPSGSQMPPVVNGDMCLREGSGRGEAGPSWDGAPGPACRSRFLQGNAKRSVLRNITAFLFLCNISLWIPPAFGCRPEYDNGLEEIVFGFEPWIIVVNLAMPFSIFYRMHAAASLFEVYCRM